MVIRYVCNQKTLLVSSATLERRGFLLGVLSLADAYSSGVSHRPSANACQEGRLQTGVRYNAETHNYSQKSANCGVGTL